MDKSWIKDDIKSKPFKKGVKYFIEFARARSIRGIIACPCLKCRNAKHWEVDKCYDHVLRYGFLPGYTNWSVRGENSVPSQPSRPTSGEDEIRSLVRDALRHLPSDSPVARDSMFEDSVGESSQTSHGRVHGENLVPSQPSRPTFAEDEIISLIRDALGQIPFDEVGDPMFQDENVDESSKTSDDSATYKKLLEECDKELYPGCKYSNLSFTLHLYHVKCIGDVSNKTFGMLLELIRDAFPHLTSLPSSVNEAKKLTKDLGLGYEKIDACPNDCMIYWGTRKGQTSCHVCKASRYKSDTGDDKGESSNAKKSNKSAKVLRYFPLIPRLKRLYMSEKTAKDMRWPNMGRKMDGKLRHPADGLAWKDFNARYSDFASDPRSIRLGLASDGVNPFGKMSTSHSTWTVLLIPYNLPPWLCMKQQSFILSSVIPGEKAPGNDIDVYLQPLIHELKLLWKGVDAYDAFSKQQFKLRDSLMWTVNDFPAYANLSGWSTKGRVACPVCANSTRSSWLKYGRKFCYMGHRRWLQQNHKYRFQNDQFDGTVEEEGPPTPLTGSDILEELSGASFIYGKSADDSSNNINKRKRDGVGCSTNAHDEANAESSSFEDIENFVEEEMDGKTKDNENARKDLMEMGIRHELHLINRPNKKPYMPPPCYTMSSVEKYNFLQVLKSLKVPDGYLSNISRGVRMKDRKLINLKSHDDRILMQDVLPIALRVSMLSRTQSRVVKVVSDICLFFKRLCAKVLDPDELDKMESEIALTLCEMEKLFPPSFFTIMVHLTVNLIPEARLGGPVHYRWMYPIERYFEGVETLFNRPPRNDEHILEKEMYILNSGGRKLGKVEIIELDHKSLAQAHRYVILNHSKFQPFRDHFLLQQQAYNDKPMNSKIKEKLMVEVFPQWLQEQVPFLEKIGFDEEVVSIASGPRTIAKQYDGIITNGYRFLTKRREKFKKTQKSEVIVEVEGGNYYGKLSNIIELEYFGGYKVVLFRCDWVDIRSSRGLMRDKYGCPLVNFTRPLIHTGDRLEDDPFIISSQARQVFYIDGLKYVGWSHVIVASPRDMFNMGKKVIRDDDESYTQCMPYNLPTLYDVNEAPSWHRKDIEVEDDE